MSSLQLDSWINQQVKVEDEVEHTYFPGDHPPILHFLFPQLQLTALVPISKIKPSLTENPWGCMCQEPVLELKKKVSKISMDLIRE